MSQVLISIVIPIYNSKKILPNLFEAIYAYAQSRSQEKYEVIFVNDCSPDNAWEIIKDLQSQHPDFVRGIKFSRNFGQQPATIAGIAHAEGDFVITMDDDLQHHPEDIPLLLAAYQQEKDTHIVIAHLQNKKTTGFKKFVSNMNRRVTSTVLNKPKDIHLSAFRLIDRFVVDKMLEIQTAFPFIPALMFTVTKKVVNVSLEHRERYAGKSNYSIKRMVQLSSRLLINNSTLMLDMIATLGILIASLSFLGIMTIVGLRMSGIAFAPGWVSIISSIYLIGGLILFSLGIIGKYLQRILVEVTNIPNYVIEDII